MLRGTIRVHVTQQRLPFVRFFDCEEDLSHERPHGPKTDLTPGFVARSVLDREERQGVTMTRAGRFTEA